MIINIIIHVLYGLLLRLFNMHGMLECLLKNYDIYIILLFIWFCGMYI